MEERITRDQYFMEFAYVATLRSTCGRLQVGAVIVRDDAILATGYNGAPRNTPHCDHTLDSHNPCKLAVHAEMNAIIFAGKEKCEDSTMYITHAPCLACSGPMINSGLHRVVFNKHYKNEDGLMNLKVGGVIVSQVEG